MGNIFKSSQRNDTAEIRQQLLTIEALIDELNGKMDDILALNSLVLSTLNVYEAMSVSSAGRSEGLKERFCSDLGYSNKKCMLTGVEGNMTLAHIFPFSGRKNAQAMSLLQLTPEKLNTYGNLLLLASNIEIAFDQLKVSFVPAVGNGLESVFVLRIWDNSVRLMPIFDGSLHLIGDYDGQALTFNKDHQVFKRCFAFQSMWAAVKYLGGDFRVDTLTYRLDSLDKAHKKLFLATVKAKQMELFSALGEEVEE